MEQAGNRGGDQQREQDERDPLSHAILLAEPCGGYPHEHAESPPGPPRFRRAGVSSHLLDSCFTQSTSMVQLGRVIGASLILAKFRIANIGSGNSGPAPAMR